MTTDEDQQHAGEVSTGAKAKRITHGYLPSRLHVHRKGQSRPYEATKKRTISPHAHPTNNPAPPRDSLLLKGSLVTVSRTDGDTERNSLLLGLSSNILVNGDGRVDSSSLEEQGSDGSTGSLGSDEDDVDVGGGDDTGLEKRLNRGQ